MVICDKCLKDVRLPDGFFLVPNTVDGIATLEAQAFSDPWGKEGVIAHVNGSGGVALSVSHRGDVVAYLLASLLPEAGEGELYRICVREDHRGHGLGGALMRALDAVALTEGVQDMYLEVRASNAPARQCYEKNGWCVIGTRKGYYKNPTEDAVLMHKALFGN